MCAVEVSLINSQIITNYMVLHKGSTVLFLNEIPSVVVNYYTYDAVALLFMWCGLVFGFSFHSLAFYLSICRSFFPFHFLFFFLSIHRVFLCHFSWCTCVSGFSVFKGHFLRHLICVCDGTNCGIPSWNVKYAGEFFACSLSLGIICLPLPTTMRENRVFHATCWNRPNSQHFKCNVEGANGNYFSQCLQENSIFQKLQILHTQDQFVRIHLQCNIFCSELMWNP